eukprot:5870033-Karenia_brevis.AAC.1
MDERCILTALRARRKIAGIDKQTFSGAKTEGREARGKSRGDLDKELSLALNKSSTIALEIYSGSGNFSRAWRNHARSWHIPIVSIDIALGCSHNIWSCVLCLAWHAVLQLVQGKR